MIEVEDLLQDLSYFIQLEDLVFVFIVFEENAVKWEDIHHKLESVDVTELKEEIALVYDHVELLLRPKGAPNKWTILKEIENNLEQNVSRLALEKSN